MVSTPHKPRIKKRVSRRLVIGLIASTLISGFIIVSVAVSLGNVAAIFTRFQFQELWTAHLTLADANRLSSALKLASTAPDRPASREVLAEANDYAYIRFFTEDRRNLLKIMPDYQPIYPRMNRLIEAVDAMLATEGPLDAARLQSIQTDLQRVIAEMSQLYYSFGQQTNADLEAAALTLDELSFRVGIILALFFLLAIVAVLLFAKQHRAARDLHYQTLHDVLTGLKNRAWLQEHNEPLFDKAHLTGQLLDLYLIDLDSFKQVNDTFGHAMGDAVLIHTAEVLREFEIPGRIIALRLGGDELALLAMVDNEETASALRAEVSRKLNQPADVLGRRMAVGVSIGVATYPTQGAELEALSRHADLALYCAKDAGRGRLTVFDASEMGVMEEREDLKVRMASALENQEFELYWQPIFDLRTASLSGAEAYLRWHDKHLDRLLLPGDFLPLAERSDMIFDIDRMVLMKACSEAARWEAEFNCDFVISVNISAVNLQSENFPDYLAGVASRAGLSPRRLEIDITESVLSTDREMAISVIHHIRKLGFRVAIDDFGKGHADLHYLAEVEVERLKIHGSFLSDIANQPRKQALVASVIAAGQQAGAEIVAEGLETATQMQFLLENGCDYAQGYLLAKPVASSAFRSYLRRNLANSNRAA